MLLTLLGQLNLSSGGPIAPRLYAVIGLAAGWATPSAAAVIGGSGFAWAGSVVAPTSTTTFDWPTAADGLTGGTSYRLAVVWHDGITSSNVVVSDEFATAPAGTNIAATSSTGAITQAHALAGAGSAQPRTSGTAAISQAHALAAAACTQASTSSAAAISQAHALAAAACARASTSSTGAISQAHQLAAAACAQAGSSGAGEISLGEIEVPPERAPTQLLLSSGQPHTVGPNQFPPRAPRTIGPNSFSSRPPRTLGNILKEH